MGFTAAGISPTTVTTTQQAPLGFVLTVPNGDNGAQEWLYVFNDEASTSFVEGTLIQRDAATATCDGIVSTGAVSPQRIMGVAQHTIAAGSYGFILRKGIGQILCDGNVSADTAVCPDANAGQATDVAAVTNAAIGVALAADAGAATKVSAFINCTG
jgi:hypothetical protein